MSNFRLASATQNALANAVRAQIDAHGAGGKINFYDGVQPASPNIAVSTQKLLATLPFASPSFSNASGGTITAGGIGSEPARASGTCTWARIVDASGYTVCDCDVGTAGATINLNTTAIVQNGPVVISSFSITVPGG
jgi:hypothetical protein